MMKDTYQEDKMKYEISDRVGQIIAAGLFLNAAIGLAHLVKATSANAAPQPKVMAVYLSDKTGKPIQPLPVFLVTKDGTAIATKDVGTTRVWSGLPTTTFEPAIRTVSEPPTSGATRQPRQQRTRSTRPGR
jgi:hypothetical protein